MVCVVDLNACAKPSFNVNIELPLHLQESD